MSTQTVYSHKCPKCQQVTQTTQNCGLVKCGKCNTCMPRIGSHVVTK